MNNLTHIQKKIISLARKGSHDLYIRVISKEYQTEAEDTCGAKQGAGSAGGKLGEEGIWSDEKDEVVNGHLHLLARPQVIDEQQLARDREQQGY